MTTTNVIKKTKGGYTPRVTIFASGRNTHNKRYIGDAETLACRISEAGYGINTGGGQTGLMGVVARETGRMRGSLFGIALGNREPEPSPDFTEYEAYTDHYDRQRRLIELGDAFIALPGAVGTFHEILEIQILNILGEIHKPLVLVGDYFERHKTLIDSFVSEELMHADPTPLFYAKDGEKAASIVLEYLDSLVEQNYSPPIYYPAAGVAEIYKHVLKSANTYRILFAGLVMAVFPGVYPSNRFRSSKLFARLVREVSKGKKIADIACGHGAMGLVALDAGATEVVMSDINSVAVQNAKYNLESSPHADKGVVFESDLFEKIRTTSTSSSSILRSITKGSRRPRPALPTHSRRRTMRRAFSANS